MEHKLLIPFIEDSLISNAQLLQEEKLSLFSLIYTLKPKNVLEIGSYQGGSAIIIYNALEANKLGTLTLIDKNPKIPPNVWQKIKKRTTIHIGDSFKLINSLFYNNNFDFVFIDGDHTFNGVIKDSFSAIKILNKDGYILYHDCHHDEIEKAINHIIKKFKNINDCGIISTKINKSIPEQIWGGFRLLRKLD